MFSMLGMLISLLSALFFVFLVIRRLIIGPEAEGLFTLFALMFFLIGIALFGIGLLGEYVGRIYQQVRHRPRYLVEAVLEDAAAEKPKSKRSKKIATEELTASSLFPDELA
jgi:undecaprenyl-phosphate 4-deoxy-4-formamido-L-arabinose transferase